MTLLSTEPQGMQAGRPQWCTNCWYGRANVWHHVDINFERHAKYMACAFLGIHTCTHPAQYHEGDEKEACRGRPAHLAEPQRQLTRRANHKRHGCRLKAPGSWLAVETLEPTIALVHMFLCQGLPARCARRGTLSVIR